MQARRDSVVTAFLRRHGGNDPEVVIRRLCDRLLGEAGATVPVDMRMLASFRGVAEIVATDQREPGCVYFDGERLVIRTRRADSEERRRFTIGHEIGHTFFPGFREERRNRPDPAIGRFDPRGGEEYLCDVAAAELLLPRAEVRGRLRGRPIDLETVIELAGVFRAGIEATALRVAALCGRPAAVAVLEPGWRKADDVGLRRLRAARLAVPLPVPAKLRVRWSASHHGFPVIPRNKSVGDDTPLAGILGSHRLDYRGETGLIPGQVAVSARYLPYRRDDAIVQRVLLLLRP